jgi:geranylgeranyl reductase family protein
MYDLIVVGAGPAGTSAARSASKSGLKTLLIEKDRIPRHKLCGGGITPKVTQLLGFKLPDELVECTVKSARIHVGDQTFNYATDQPLTYMTTRANFDAFLTSKAKETGSEVLDQAPVTNIEANDSHVEVTTKKGIFRSKLLIGADGMGGPTAKLVHLYDHWKPHQVAYAMESEVSVGERHVHDFIGPNQYFDMYFGVSSAGYGWVFPKGDHLTVGVSCRLSRLRDARELFDAFVRKVVALNGFEIPKPQAYLIPVGGPARVPMVSKRVMLAGDCAGFAEPLLGEGIYFSILGGKIAANIARMACQRDRYDEAFLRTYERECEEAFGRDFDVAYRVACFSYLEEYHMDRVVQFFFRDKRVRECMIGLMKGSIRYRDAKAKLAWTYFKYRLAKLGIPFYR